MAKGCFELALTVLALATPQTAVPCAAYRLPFTTEYKYAAFDDAYTIDASRSTGVEIFVGKASWTSPKPLFRTDKPWEAKLDNGYPSVIYDPDESPAFRLWYDAFVSCDTHPPVCSHLRDQIGMMYAESDDGMNWRKPAAFDNVVMPKSVSVRAGHPVTHTNVIRLNGHGFGVFKDPVETNRSRLYKAFGMLGRNNDGGRGSYGGTMVSRDGIHWTDERAHKLEVRWDTHHCLFWDHNYRRYVLMSRAMLENGWRGVATSVSSNESFDDFTDVQVVASPNTFRDQIYTAQVFPYYGVYMAFMMTYSGHCNTSKFAFCGDRVRCELAWSSDLKGWKRFRPAMFQTKEAPSHYGRLPFADKDTDELIPLRNGSYNSHDCFAAKPVEVPGEGLRVYFMAGNGPHFKARNTSFALAKVRFDGLVGVRSSKGSHARLVTLPLLVAGFDLFVTADFGAEGRLRAEVVDEKTFKAIADVPVGELRSAGQVTDKVLLTGGPFAELLGLNVRIVFTLQDVSLYTFGFGNFSEAQTLSDKGAAATADALTFWIDESLLLEMFAASVCGFFVCGFGGFFVHRLSRKKRRKR